MPKNSKKRAHPADAPSKAIKTDKWTEILFRALTARIAKRWKFTSFRGAKGRESAGIVDVVAIRRNTKRTANTILKSGDLFDIILIQMKGGSAKRPTLDARKRLMAVKQHYGAIDVVLFEWTKQTNVSYSRLGSDLEWEKYNSAKEVFG